MIDILFVKFHAYLPTHLLRTLHPHQMLYSVRLNDPLPNKIGIRIGHCQEKEAKDDSDKKRRVDDSHISNLSLLGQR